jgi:hypothetical protein
MGSYGYTDAQWNAAKEEMRKSLVSRARDEGTMHYTELTTKIPSIHFAADDHGLHHMLGEVSEEEDAAGRGMLSVIVVHKEGDQMPGPGFFVLAKKLGRDTSDRVRCWADELTKVYACSKST